MPPHPRTSPVNAPAERDARISARMQQGWTYDAIAKKEEVSRERVRQIINAALKSRGGEPNGLHRLVQLAGSSRLYGSPPQGGGRRFAGDR